MGNNFKSDLCCHNESSENQAANFITVVTNFFICANISKEIPFYFYYYHIILCEKKRSLVLASHRQIKQSSKKCEMFFAKMYNNNNI